MNYLALLVFILFALPAHSQEEAPRRDSGGWEYNGVFKFSDKLKLENESGWNFTAIDILITAGPRYHRYDPIRLADDKNISAFTRSSYFGAIGLEYRFYKHLSLIANWGWETQDVERYDGLDFRNTESYSREMQYGAQFNLDPFFASYELGSLRMPHYYLDSADEFSRRYVDIDSSIIRAGFRRKITETFSLSFSMDYARSDEFIDPFFGKMKSETVGINVLLLHSSGFGIRLREQEGQLESDTYKYKTKTFGIMPFMSLL